MVGFTILVFVFCVAILGPIFAPHGIATPIGAPGQTPSGAAPLGTDYLGRDVLSRLLNGGRSVIWIAGVAMMLPYLIGFAIVKLAGMARIVRTATLEMSTRGFVEAAEARGESTPSLLTREILPNIAPILLADFGIRFGYSIILIASVNYLGLGLAPPAADWGLMMSENQQFIAVNVWAVLAPAIMLALLTIGVNLMADAYVRTLGRSTIVRTRPSILMTLRART